MRAFSRALKISASGRKAFTFVELIAVVVMMAFVATMAVGFFSNATRNLRKGAYLLSRDIQSTYALSSQHADFFRLLVNEDRRGYQLQKFEPPQPRPVENDSDPNNRKKIEEWENAQRDLDNMNALERTAMTRLQRGSFKTFKQVSLPGSIIFKSVTTARGLQKDKKDDKEPWAILFFPSGEVDQSLIVLDGENAAYFSLEVSPLTGRVTSSLGEITEQEWKKSIKGS